MTVDLSSARPERNAQAMDLVVLVVACGFLLPAGIATLRGSTIPTPWLWADGAAIVLLQSVLITYRRWPVWSYVAACAAMLVLALSPHLSADGRAIPAVLLPSAVLFFFALYAVALRRDARTAMLALGVAIVGGGLISYRLSVATGWTSQLGAGVAGWLILSAVAFIGAIAAWALGRLRSTRLAFLAELEERARRNDADRLRENEEAAADERARIAAEMHDVVSHSLAVIVSQAEGGRMVAADDQTREVLRTISATGRTALTDMRSMLGVLRSDDVRRGAPQAGSSAIPDLVAKSGAKLEQTGRVADVTGAVGISAYRIVQESLTNSLKHAAGGAVVQLSWGDDLVIAVTNPAAAGAEIGAGSGIAGMRRRAEAVGGTLDAGHLAGQWRVRAVLPLEDK